MAAQPPRTVAMEACPSSHYRARELAKLGHSVVVISPQHVASYVKRQNNDAADAEAIAEPATRPHMRFVKPRSAAQLARGVVFRIRQKVIAQRIELVNALRSHLCEFGCIAPVGLQHLPKPVAVLEDETSALPGPARVACLGILRQIGSLGDEIALLDAQIAELSRESRCARLLQAIPGVSPITPMQSRPSHQRWKRTSAGAISPHGSGSYHGRPHPEARPGRVSKAGQHDIRRRLIVGAMAAIVGACRGGIPEDTWLCIALATRWRGASRRC